MLGLQPCNDGNAPMIKTKYDDLRLKRYSREKGKGYYGDYFCRTVK